MRTEPSFVLLCVLATGAGACDAGNPQSAAAIMPSAGQQASAAGDAAGARAGGPAGGAAAVSGAGTGSLPTTSGGNRATAGNGAAGANGQVAGAGPAGGSGASGSAGAAGSGGQVGAAGTAGVDSAGNAGSSGSSGASSANGADYWDSFESITALDATRYETVAPNCSGTGMIALDTTQGHSGSQAVRVQGAGGFCNHVFLRASALGATLPSPLYVRVFVKVSMPLGAGHTTFMAVHDTHEDKDLRLGGQNEVLIWNRESDDATLPELSPTGVSMSKALGTSGWQCLEWMLDTSTREMRTWLDGQDIPGLTLDAEPTADVDRQWLRKTDWQPALTDLRFGWESYGDQAETLWFDDFAVGKARVGCGPDPSPRSP